ncbi:hypothetical protein LNP04_11070 [Chryseobacterium sp. C-71]|uniref:hypothetical protein n=1 Tax=Chryseobacterium sp. C-71 TaxID=2893882 RepID=UPI001E36AE1B|nr:hypothetical protein [Chryseobacterium sp. C-71]UFH30518.1 hypothetical protein LNP04_11070 [Chryseobacterium sp. C-71]
MTNIDNCPECKEIFEFSRKDVHIKFTVSLEGKTYRVYHYRKICPHCSKALFMETGMPSDNNGKWAVSKRQEKK